MEGRAGIKEGVGVVIRPEDQLERSRRITSPMDGDSSIKKILSILSNLLVIRQGAQISRN